MDPYTFTDAMTGKLIWPLLVLFFGYYYRTQIKMLLESISQLKIGDSQVTFHRELEEAKKIQAGSDLKVVPLQIPESLLGAIKASPSIAISSVWELLEKALRESALSNGIDSKVVLPASIAWELMSKGILIQSELEIVIKLNEMRNTIIHAFSPKISPSEAMGYVTLSLPIINKLSK